MYSVKSISSFDCKDWLLHKHYARRIPPIEYAFGLYDNDKLIGVCTYGTPVSNALRQIYKQYKLIELNRLITNDNLNKNACSFFVSKTLKKLPKPFVIVSYADTSKNHNGYVYQASNFFYTGLSAKRIDYCIKGMEHLHSASIYDLSRGKENRIEWLKEKFGDDLYMKERPRKHRYFYFLGSKTQKKHMRKMLPYKVCEYPKGDNVNYDASYTPNTQIKLL